MNRVQHTDDGGTDPNSDAPEGAEGDGNRVTIRDDQNDRNDPDANQDDSDDNRPEWLPEKFESPEAMAKAYSELETKMSQGGDDADDDEGSDEGSEDSEADEGGEDLSAEEAVEKAGLDVEALNSEIQENGELTDETYEAFEEAGIGRDMVDSYIEGQQALAQNLYDDLANVAGGSDEFESMLDWAEDGLDADEVQAFNVAMEQGGAAAKMAVRSLKSAYGESEGIAPNLQRPGTKRTPTGAQPFASNEEMVQAMRDPRYKTDKAYRKKVENRLGAS